MFYYSPEAVRSRKQYRINQPQRSDKTHRTELRNCNSCKYLESCEHPDKSFDFLCNKYDELAELSDQDYLNMLVFGTGSNEQAIAEETDAQDRINSMIERAISDQSLGIQTDFVLEDQDIELPKNFFDFYFNKNFESERRPFPKQIEISMNYLTEICYSCSDEKYARNIPTDAKIDEIQDKVKFLEHGVCPKCSKTKFDMWNDYNCRRADTLALIAGQRSGKDYEIAFLYPYQDARMLKLRSPAKALNIAPGTVLHSTFTATTFYQARDTTWAPYVENIEKSKWFQQYHKMLDHVGQKRGKKLYDFGKEAIIWNYHGLTSAIKSPDVRNLRGVARRAANITELGWFYTKSKGSVRLDPDEVLNALSRSMLTMRAGYRQCLEQGKFDTPSIMLTIASSPSSIKDKAMRLLKESERNKNIYPAHYSVYQMNPGIKPEDLESEKISDFVAYKRDYLAIPPNAVKAFIPDRRLIMNCIDPDRPNAIKGRPKTVVAPSGARLMAADMSFVNKNVDKTSPKVLFLDGGEKNNCFSGNTKVITDKGTKRIKDLVGYNQLVTVDGKWVKAKISNFGESHLYKILISLNGVKKTIEATGNHRWFVKTSRNKIQELTTENLKLGAKLVHTFPENRHKDLKLVNEGIRHGIIFGDGHVHGNKIKWSCANLVGDKIKDLLPYFKKYKSRGKYWDEIVDNELPIIKIRNLDVNYKNLPDLNNNYDYLLSFLAGYIATDGCVDHKGCVMLNSVNKNNIQHVRDIANILGIPTSSITEQTAKSKFNNELFTTFKIFFLRSYFPYNILLNSKHKTKAEKASKKIKTRKPNQWKIESVTKTNKKEVVYCAEVPETYSFVLEDYILTGNSFAMCLAHLVDDEDKNGREQFYTVVDALFEVIPEQNKPVDYVYMLDEIIMPICEEFNVVMVGADRYKGTMHHLQTIDQELEIDTIVRSIAYHDFVKFKQALLQSTIDIPQIEIKDYNVINELGQKNYPQSFNGKPVAHMLIQSVTVEDLMGKKVDKGDGFTDDLFYAMVGAFTLANDPELMESFIGTGLSEVVQDELVAVSRGYDGRSSDISIRGGQNQGNDLIAVYKGYRDR